MDLNFDGRFDLVRSFDRAGRTVREEMDLDQDGELDQVTVYRDGSRLATILDTNADRRGDTYRCYRANRTVMQQNDLDADGRFDRWEWFDERGQMIGSSGDADGDGEPDAPPRGLIQTDFCPSPRL